VENVVHRVEEGLPGASDSSGPCSSISTQASPRRETTVTVWRDSPRRAVLPRRYSEIKIPLDLKAGRAGRETSSEHGDPGV